MSDYCKPIAAVMVVLTLVAGCGKSMPTATPAPPTATLVPYMATSVPVAATMTEVPSFANTLIPPTDTPIPPTPLPATDTVCTSGCDFTSIQSAINAGGAIIEITDPVHTEAGIVVSEDITVTIRGLGAYATIVQAYETLEDSPERVFLIMEGATVTLEEMTVRHGRPSVEDEHGGGIMNYGTLTVRNCVITANSARGGGGIDNRHATLTIIGSTISNNVARGDGPRGVECGGGGGVKCSSGTMTLINSTIAGNQAGIGGAGLGGGIRTGCDCTAEIVNSTISGNMAAKWGGGVAAAGTVSITNCTISGNAVRGGGGALWVRGDVNLENTIIANNTGGKNCVIHQDFGGQGKLGMTSNNLIEDGSCNADFSGDPKLGHLADNGGDTLTHALLQGSPAIDAIPTISCTLRTDQRGAFRPIALISPDTPCDIGAFEVQIE